MEKIQFIPSEHIVELNQRLESNAIQLANQLRGENTNFFLEIDCSPNDNLNPFFYNNGFKSAQIINDLAASFLGSDSLWLKKKLEKSEANIFETDFSLGEKIGLWERVNANNYQEKLDWSQPFCIKNKKGITKIWHPAWRQIGYQMGLSTTNVIVKFLQEDKTYLQKFYTPLQVPHLSLQHRMHYRLVFFIGDTNLTPEFIGGIWISRVGFKTYTCKDSVVGLISPNKF